MAAAATDTIRYHVTGMDCSSCAAKSRAQPARSKVLPM